MIIRGFNSILTRTIDSLLTGTPVFVVAKASPEGVTRRGYDCAVIVPPRLRGIMGHPYDRHSISNSSMEFDYVYDDDLCYEDIFYYVPNDALDPTTTFSPRTLSELDLCEYFEHSNCENFSFLSTCSHCGKKLKSTDQSFVDSSCYCSECVKKLRQEKKIFFCNYCGYFHKIDRFYKKGMCRIGYDNTYFKCNICGKLVDSRKHPWRCTPTGNRVCFSCYNSPENRKSFIRRYHDTPELMFYKDNTEDKTPRNFKGFGVELEVDEGLENNERISKLTIDTLKNEAYTMRDGSVPKGFEIITHPHEEKSLFSMEWKKLFTELKRRRYNSERGGKCGLHLHISKRYFKDEKAVCKMLYFYEKFQTDILRFSRREKSSVERWCSFYTRPKDRITLKKAENIHYTYNHDVRGHDHKYKCVNFQKENTIEIRIMRGTIDYKDFIATLKFMIEIAKKSNTIDDSKISDYKEWLKDLDKDTISYMKKHKCFKKLY